MLNGHFALWSIWDELLWPPRLFCLILCLVSIYALYSAAIIVVRLRSLTNQRDAQDASSIRRSLVALRARCENMRQAIGASLYLFGFVFFFWALPAALTIFGEYRTAST